MWMNPSPWVWIPAWTPGLSCWVSNSGGSASHSPQMFTPITECQWSPAGLSVLGGCGATADAALSLRTNTMPSTPAITITPRAP